MDKEILKGSVDILLLSLLIGKDMYGYEMVKTLKEKSNEQYNMSEGTLYSALRRLEKKGWIQSYCEDSASSNRRKYYRIVNNGEKELYRKLAEWRKINNLIKVSSEGLIWRQVLKPSSEI